MGSLVKKILDEQYDIFSSFENLKEFLKLGLPKSWEMGKILISLDKLINNISLEVGRYNNSGLEGDSKFYEEIHELKNLLINREKWIISELESLGYEFVYSKSGKNILERINGLKNPLIEDCVREKEILLTYKESLKKIKSFFYKNHPGYFKFSTEELENRISEIEEIIEEEDFQINDFYSTQEKGENPRMDLYFSSQVRFNKNQKNYEETWISALEILGYSVLYKRDSIKKISKINQTSPLGS